MKINELFGADAEEHLAFFARIISGKKTSVTLDDSQRFIYADVANRSIHLSSRSFDGITDDGEVREAVIATVLHEAAHIRFSGEYDGDDEEFVREILNVVEDVRIETHLCTAYPQAKQLLVQEFERVAKKLMRRGAHNTDVLVAIRFLLENKTSVPLSTNQGFKDVMLWVEREAYLRQIWSGTWKDAIQFAEDLKRELERCKILREGCILKAWDEKSFEAFTDSGEDARLSRDDLKQVTSYEDDIEDAPKRKSRDVLGELERSLKKGAGSNVEVRINDLCETTDLSAPKRTLPSEHHAESQGQQAASDLKHRLRINKALAKGKRSGALDISSVKRAMKKDAPLDRVFAKKEKRENHKHSVCVLLDSSGSMYPDRISWALQAIKMIDETLSRLNSVDYSIRAFSATDGVLRINDVIIKDFGSTERISWDHLMRMHILKRSASGEYEGQNRDGDSIRHAANLLSQKSGKKLLIVVSDGEPHHGGTKYYGKEANVDTRHAVQDAEAAGVMVFGISIDESANESAKFIYGDHAMLCTKTTLQQLGELMVDLYVEKMQGVR